MSTEATRAAARELYAAYGAGDQDRIAALIGDDVDWIIHAPGEVFPFAGARRGKAAVLEALGAVGQHYVLARYEPGPVIADGDRAATMTEVAFTQRATGRLLRMRFAQFMRFEGGKLVEFREFMDTFDAVEQVLGTWIDLKLAVRA